MDLGKEDLVIFYYHLVNDDSVPHITHLYKYKNKKQFVADLDFLLKHYFPVSLSEVISWSNKRSKLPPNSFLLTFDDGFREIYDIIGPILLEKGIPATFFICNSLQDNHDLHYHHKASLLINVIKKGISAATEKKIINHLYNVGIPSLRFPYDILSISYLQQHMLDKIAEILDVDFADYLKQHEPYLTTKQITDLIAKGFSIGSHSFDHIFYSSLTLAEQLGQTIKSVQQIRESFGLDYGAFAFPHDDHGVSSEFFKIVKESGEVDITFGTAGLLKSPYVGHWQRVSLENPLLPAREILSWQYARKLYKQLL